VRPDFAVECRHASVVTATKRVEARDDGIRCSIKRIEAATRRIAAVAAPPRVMTTRLIRADGVFVGEKSGWEPQREPGEVITDLATRYEIVELRHPDLAAGESEAVLVLKPFSEGAYPPPCSG
jgi:hypothetical protein